MEEKIFYSNRDVFVSESRFVVGKTTYSMRNISSVTTWIKRPKRIGFVIMLILGILFFCIASAAGGSVELFIISVLWIIGAILNLIIPKKKYTVRWVVKKMIFLEKSFVLF